MSWTQLTSNQWNEFLRLNGIQSSDNPEAQIQMLFRNPQTQYTVPFVDAHIASQLNSSLVPQSYTPTQIVNLTPDQKQMFANFLKVPISADWNVRVVRILHLAGFLKLSEDANDQLFSQAFPGYAEGKFYEDSFDNALQRKDWTQIEEIMELEGDHQSFIESAIQTQDPETFNKIWEFHNKHFDDHFFPHIDEMFDVALETRNVDMIKAVSDQLLIGIDQEQYYDLLRMAIQTGDINILNVVYDESTPLNEEDYAAAIRSNSVQFLEYIKTLPYDEDAEILDDAEQMKIAAQENAVQIITYLFQISSEPRADLFQAGANGAAIGGHLELLKWFISQGASNYFFMAMEAIVTDQGQILMYLLDNYEFSPEQLNDLLIESVSKSRLFMHSGGEWSSYFEKLFEKGATQWSEALKEAIRRRNNSILSLIIETGALGTEDINAALLTAIQASNTEAVQILIQRGATDLNDFLILAVSMGRIQIISILIQAGANNLQQAYEAASEEKKRWAQRSLPQYFGNF